MNVSDVNKTLWTACARQPSISLMLKSNGPGPSAPPISPDCPFGGSLLLSRVHQVLNSAEATDMPAWLSRLREADELQGVNE